MELYDFLFQFAIILITTKIFGILSRKLGLPQVLGYIVAGILIGCAIWGLIFDIPEYYFFPIQRNNPYIKIFAEVGVIFVMFTAGLETNLKDIRETGFLAIAVAAGGVLLPLGAGIGLGALFLPNEGFLTWLFLGTIITATSVGITVEVLKELGKLKGKVGTVILSAAIIDDVLGIMILAIVLSLSGGSTSSSPVVNAINPSNHPAITIAWIFAFFVVAIGLGFGLSKLFKYIEKKAPHTRRIPILSIAVCLLYAFMAEKVFGVADITGAYIAGLVLSTNHKSAEYVDRRVTISSYMIFAPMFFASIGINMSFKGLSWDILLFAVAFVVVAILTKIIGCGGVAKCFKFKWNDSAKIGVGMIARGEVALIVAQKGIDGGIMGSQYLTIVVLLVLVSSLLAPILLKLLFKKDKDQEPPLPTHEALEEGSFE